MKKKLPVILLVLFVVSSVYIFINRERLRMKPWAAGADLNTANFVSGNGERIVVIDDSEMTVLVLAANREFIYRLNAASGPEKAFVKAQIALLDEENNLYLYDKRFEGIQEENVERIIKYSPRGKYLGELYSYRYTNNDFILSKGKISGMAYASGFIYILRIEDDGIYLEKTGVTPGGAAEQIVFVPYPHSFRDLGYSHINPAAGRFVVTTKTGIIRQYGFDGVLAAEYGAEEGTLPWMTVNLDDSLVYSDIHNNRLVKISESGEKTPLYEKSEGDAYYYLDYSSFGDFYAAYSDDVFMLPASSDEGETFMSYLYSRTERIFAVVTGILCVLDGLLVLVLFIFSVSLIRSGMNDVLKRILLIGFSIAFGAGISSLLIINEMTARYNETTYSDLENVSRLTATMVDTDLIASIDSPARYDDEDYMALSEKLRSQLAQLSFKGKRVYQFIWKVYEDMVCVMYDMESSVGLLYPYYMYEGSDQQKVAETGEYIRSSDITSSGHWIFACGPLYDSSGNIAAFIETGYDMAMVREQIQGMVIQTVLIVITATVAFLLLIIEFVLVLSAHKKTKREYNRTSFLFRPEMLKASIIFLANAYKKVKSGAGLSEAQTFRPELLRAIIFFLFFTGNLATALLPMYASNLYQPLGKIPQEIVVTLPFIADMAFAAIALLVIPVILPKVGLKKIGFVSAILLVAGNAICFIASNTAFLAAAYALTGFSGGALILVINTIIGAQKKVENVNRGFAHFSASYLAGVNVGVVFGSILAQFFTYRTVYLFSSVSALLLFLVVFYFIRAKHLDSLFRSVSFFKDRRKWTLVKFLVQPIVIATLLLLLLPFMISQNFVQYFMPLFGIQNGLRESNIGQLIILNGLFAILFGTALCEYASKKLSPKIIVIGSLLLNLLAIYLFTWFMTIPVLIFSIVLLAIANIFALTNIQTYYATLYRNSRTSSVKALSAYSAVENLSMAIGPVVFSYILAGTDLVMGLRIFAAALLGCLLLFLLVSLFFETEKEKK
ncbi:MAG: MFS transporter [Treponema sp.]|jgi:DHA1 family multidrug resistance protein-like MFS transporter|nr:MFS transporter [Treponema sp.]